MTESEAGAFDERYVRFREHSNVLERVTALEGRDAQIMGHLSRIEDALRTRPVLTTTGQPQQETAAALALHRTLDYLDKKQGGGGTPTVLIFFALIGALALGGVLVWVLTGAHH